MLFSRCMSAFDLRRMVVLTLQQVCTVYCRYRGGAYQSEPYRVDYTPWAASSSPSLLYHCTSSASRSLQQGSTAFPIAFDVSSCSYTHWDKGTSMPTLPNLRREGHSGIQLNNPETNWIWLFLMVILAVMLPCLFHLNLFRSSRGLELSREW